MNDLSSMAAFLLLGLLTGFGHCPGMCGPFSLWIAHGGAPSTERPTRASALGLLLPQALYLAGRTSTYAALGALVGLLGSVVELGGSLFGIQRAAALTAGACLCLYAGLGLAGLAAREGKTGRLSAWLGGHLERLARRPFVLGLALGLLPCGPLYSALIGSAGLGSPVEGAVALGLFGLGTGPGMLALGLVAAWAQRFRTVLRILLLLVMLGMGWLFLWQAIRLG